jgi:hypothetical protein
MATERSRGWERLESRGTTTSRELTQKMHEAEMRTQVLEMALTQIAEHPSENPEALQQLATQGLQKAAKVRSSTPVTSS